MSFESIASTMFGLPSTTFLIYLAFILFLFKVSALPDVAHIVNPKSTSFFAIGIIFCLSSSFIEINTSPFLGRLTLAPSWLLAKASPNVEPIPITSPVDFISGPRMTSVPGNRANGKTASFTAI